MLIAYHEKPVASYMSDPLPGHTLLAKGSGQPVELSQKGSFSLRQKNFCQSPHIFHRLTEQNQYISSGGIDKLALFVSYL